MIKKQLFFIFILSVSVLVAWCIWKKSDISEMKHDGNSKVSLIIPDQYTWVVDEQVINVNGTPTQLVGNKIRVWDTLKDIALDTIAEKFDQVGTSRISDYSGLKIIETVPSLDTPVCTLQTKQLESATEQFLDVQFIIISNDTPFALNRFCLTNNIKNVRTLSDARTREFSTQNGLFMPEYWLLARAIMIVDNSLEVLYIDYADEVTSELDILNALSYLKNIQSGSVNIDNIPTN